MVDFLRSLKVMRVAVPTYSCSAQHSDDGKVPEPFEPLTQRPLTLRLGY